MSAQAPALPPAAIDVPAPRALVHGARLALEIAPLIAIFVMLERRLMMSCRLPEQSYFEPSIFVQLALQTATQKSVLVALAGLAALAWLRGPLLWRRWSDLDHGRALQWAIGAVALGFAWMFATYEVNFYYGRTHAFDRALLFGLALLVCRRPVFLFGFVPLLLAIIWQFEYPLEGYSWTDKQAPLRMLLLFLAWFLWSAISRSRRTDAFVFTACCLVAAHYWVPGLEKLRIGWLGHGNLHHLTFAAWRNGWLAGLDPSQLGALLRALAVGEPVSLAFTIAAEAGALFVMLRRGVAFALLASWVLLHTAIFATSGILFWKWALGDAALFGLLLSLAPDARARIFGPVPLLVSLLLIPTAPLWCTPVRLGWYDTRVADTYQYEVVGASGRTYRVAASFFKPYALSMAQNRLAYLSRRPTLLSTYGMTQERQVAELLLEPRTFAEVEALEAQLGENHYDERRAARFAEFARRALAAKRDPDRERPWYTRVHAPIHIWTAPSAPAYAAGDIGQGLIVERVTTLWNGDRAQERVERVLELDLADPPPVGM